MPVSRRHAPAFQVETLPQPGLQVLIAMTAALSTFAALIALSAHASWGVYGAFTWILVPIAAALGWRCARIERRRLRWDGQQWLLTVRALDQEEEFVRIEVLFDFGVCLLLRATSRPSGRCSKAVYLPFSRRGQAQWSALRACIYLAKADVLET